jgi:hypothetical protein
MQPGTQSQALELAKVRWAEIWPFDLDLHSWEELFQQHRAADILQAIRRTKSTRATEPSDVFRSLLYGLGRVEQERTGKANLTWPPPLDIQQN